MELTRTLASVLQPSFNMLFQIWYICTIYTHRNFHQNSPQMKRSVLQVIKFTLERKRRMFSTAYERLSFKIDSTPR
ncbi:hypothetical protein MIMGU_mgv1a017431mg [Erythranthe guttata]|uniref:Uncharacterized protein n=1 Tax=Erythranthe guttata TaxID=4155 RepID=A0A022RVX8_ERYGU|nr:hypothetical protein MIMGU_mgv1a017431mg [Erythranthe guttata]